MAEPDARNDRLTTEHPLSLNAGGRPSDLFVHFADCIRLGSYLTLPDREDAYVISDHLRNRHEGTALARLGADAAAVAAIFSRDPIVAESALVPLGWTAGHARGRDRERLERLFALVIEQATESRVRESAAEIMQRRFLDSRIIELEREIGSYIAPARRKFRAFIALFEQVGDGRMTPADFHDEFVAFTKAVAGRIDFGVYSACLDGIISAGKIPFEAKARIVNELMDFPRLIRRELLTNALVRGRGDENLLRYIRTAVIACLDAETATEIRLLEAYKRKQITVEEIRRAAAGDMDEHVRQAVA